MGASFEHGLQLSFAAKAKEVCMLKLKQNVEVYETLEDFVGDISRKASPNVKLHNLKKTLFYFSGSLTLVSFLFIINIVLLKWRQRANQKQQKKYLNNLSGLKRNFFLSLMTHVTKRN